MLLESYELTTTEDGVELPHAELKTALWGYDRDAVHEYLERVREAVSDALEARGPDPAVREALDQVGQETSAVLKRAHEIAEEVTTRSEADAAARIEQAEREAERVRTAAEQRVAELDAEIERLWGERARLLADVDRIADELRAVVQGADERFPGEAAEAEEPADGAPEEEPLDEQPGRDPADAAPGNESPGEQPGEEESTGGGSGGVGAVLAPQAGAALPAEADGVQAIFGAPGAAGDRRAG